MKTIYINDNKKKYLFDIDEDTIIYHFVIDKSNDIEINLNKSNINLYYYYSIINYKDNDLNIRVNHNKDNTNSYIYNHGINVFDKKLHFRVDGYVPKKSDGCSCNQDNQIINLKDGNSKIWPNLLIDNFDVDANHSAYIGKFKDDYLFYLMSRGINKKSAYKLLIRSLLISSDSVDKKKIEYFTKEIDKL